jgi:hypothetical protein
MAGARAHMRAEDAHRIVDLVDRLDTLPNVVEIMDLLRCDRKTEAEKLVPRGGVVPNRRRQMREEFGCVNVS